MTEQDLAGSDGGFHAVYGEAPFAGVPRSCNYALPEDPPFGLCLMAYGGPRGGRVYYERGTPNIDHMARPRKHRLGAIGATGSLLNIVRQPRTIGDPERD